MTGDEFIKAIRIGVDWGRKPLRIVWTSPDGKYAVLHVPGGNYRSGQDTRYGRASYRLVNLHVQSKREHGYGLYTDAFIAEVDGRLNKAKLAELIAKIPTS